MAVVYKGKHHRNPSGCSNKANWLLSQTKWNISEATKLVRHITADMPQGEQRISWFVALGIAVTKDEAARCKDIAAARVIDNYISRHSSTMPHYILDYATSLRDYIWRDGGN